MSYTYADLPLSKQFDVAFPEVAPADGFRTRIRVLSITQQFAIEWDHVPHGWKTICDLDFPPDDRNPLISLPVIDAWDYTRARVGLCSADTYVALTKP